MNTKLFFTVCGFIQSLFGIGLLFFPQHMMSTYIVSEGGSNEDVLTLMRLYSTALIAFSVMSYFLRNSSDSKSKYAYLLAVLVAHILLTFLHTNAILQGVEKQSGWGTVILNALLALWGGFLLLKEKYK
jgi:uncharacterized membrane protein